MVLPPQSMMTQPAKAATHTIKDDLYQADMFETRRLTSSSKVNHLHSEVSGPIPSLLPSLPCLSETGSLGGYLYILVKTSRSKIGFFNGGRL